MRRADRRRFNKEFDKLMKAGPDNCMLCETPFTHNCRTFGGLSPEGKTVLVGDCCVNKIEGQAAGLYLTKNFDSLPSAGKKNSGATAPLKDVIQGVEAIRSHVTKLDTMADTVMQQGGLKMPVRNVFTQTSPWKTDDAAWFRAHPDRSHRLRLMFEGEAATMEAEPTLDATPENHRMEVLVRQVEVGKRIRILFCRNTQVPIPDAEEIIHALFDTWSQSNRTGVVSIEEIAALANKYSVTDGAKLN